MLRSIAMLVLLSAPLQACGGSGPADPVPQVLVTSLGNDGAGSLRNALASASRTTNVVIRFDPNLSGTILLFEPIVIEGRLTIEGAEHSQIIVRPEVGLAAFDVRPGADVTIRTLTFHGPAGAVTLQQGRLILDRVIIEDVTLTSPIDNRAGILEMSDCEIRNCTSPTPGGALRLAGGISRIRRCTFAENTSAASGGAVQHDGGVLEMVNCTLHRNRAIFAGVPSHGGAVRSADSAASVAEVVMLHCTITENEADEGGGLSFHHPVGLGVVRGSIVAQNVGAPADIDVSFLTSMEGAYNLIGDGDGTPFFNLVDGNFVGTTADPWEPFLTSLLDLGGLTRTRQPVMGSRALGMIPAANCIDTDGEPLEVDQRGFPRPQGNCEAGSFER